MTWVCAEEFLRVDALEMCILACLGHRICMTHSSSLLPDKPDNDNPDCGGPGSAGTHTLTNLRHPTASLRILRNCSCGARGWGRASRREGRASRRGTRIWWCLMYQDQQQFCNRDTPNPSCLTQRPHGAASVLQVYSQPANPRRQLRQQP